MKRMTDASHRVSLLRQFLHGERGATAIEYSVVAAGVAMAVAGAIRLLGSNVSALYDQLSGLFG